mmetsp:Transcript_9718/g.30440  ORF Transcript_9718/g.30440 Transcript_9718/m.30440 type:complete len:235 (-) Transcript_9718:205-909(-)
MRSLLTPAALVRRSGAQVPATKPMLRRWWRPAFSKRRSKSPTAAVSGTRCAMGSSGHSSGASATTEAVSTPRFLAVTKTWYSSRAALMSSTMLSTLREAHSAGTAHGSSALASSASWLQRRGGMPSCMGSAPAPRRSTACAAASTASSGTAARGTSTSRQPGPCSKMPRSPRMGTSRPWNRRSVSSADGRPPTPAQSAAIECSRRRSASACSTPQLVAKSAWRVSSTYTRRVTT